MQALDERHFLLLRDLVRLEESEENEEIKNDFLHLSASQRQLRGRALLDLVLVEKHFSPAEHILATFELASKKELPLFSLEAGDLVTLLPKKKAKSSAPILEAHSSNHEDYPLGTVYEKTKTTITIATRLELPEWMDESLGYELHQSVNRKTYRRMLEALDEVLQTQHTRLACFRDILLKKKKARSQDKTLSEPKWLDKSLNASQKESVRRALSAEDIFLLHGPPGTGKTRALVEIIHQSVLQKKSVFVTAPSNTACDNILERLVIAGLDAVRLGHPARITMVLREHTLDFKLALHPLAREISVLQTQLHQLFKRQDRYQTRRSPSFDTEKQLRQEIHEIKDNIKRLRKEIFSKVIKEAEVFVGTPSSIADRAIREKEFDLLVIDEATQATEPIAWIPMARSKKVVMAGDHFQLPPTVRSKEAEDKGLGVTLFERLYDILGPEFKVLLERQYRMNEQIMGFSSKEFYQNLLVADESVRSQTLADCYRVEATDSINKPLLFIDTAGKGFEEKLEVGSQSRYNPQEANLIIDQLKAVLVLGVPATEVAVISAYSAQVRYIASLWSGPEIEIDSVDGFQGREKEVIIVSLVRSNMEGEMGFLADTRRMNVAMTRARRKLVVIGDSATLSTISFYKDFIQYAEKIDGYLSAWEL